MRLVEHHPTFEQEALYNPALVAWTLWHSTDEYQRKGGSAGYPLPYAFLGAPLIFDPLLRASLPGASTTPLAEWTTNHGDSLARLHRLLAPFAPFTRKGILLATTSRLLALDRENATLVTSHRAKKAADESDEMTDMRNKARLIGRWLAASGNVETVLALCGVRP